MRIAFFSSLTNASWGGSEVLWSNVALQLAGEGHEVAAFVKQWKIEPLQISKLRSSGVQVFYYVKLSKTTFPKKVINKLREYISGNKNLLQQVFRWHPDFIFFSQGHSYDMGYYSAGQLQPLLETKIPFAIICQNNTDYNYIPENEIREKIKKLYGKANKVFFVSKRNKETAEMVLCDTIKNAGIISNSTSLPSANIGVLSFPENKEIQFASVARLRCSHKGQNILLHVLSQQKWIDRSWKLNLHGIGEDENFLKNLTGFFKLDERIIFHGQTSDIQNVWLNNHLLLLASFGEGMSLALQEAMLCGRPAMVTDVGGNSELITEGVTGWLAKGPTFSAIDDALERAWAAQHNWKKMGEQAHQKARDTVDLTPEITLSNYIVAVLDK